MNEELFNEAAKSNVLTKKLIDQLQESMTYSSISFINWTIEVLTLIKNRLSAVTGSQMKYPEKFIPQKPSRNL